MALETLKDKTEIGGYKVTRGKPEDVSWKDFDNIRKDFPIHITDSLNMVSFRIQNGPIKEVGINGCQVDTLVHAAKDIIEGLNKSFPSSYNLAAIAHLNLALAKLAKRKEDREARGVEGFNKQ